MIDNKIMNKLVETILQKVILLIGGLLVFFMFAVKELSMAAGLIFLTGVLLVITRDFRPSKRSVGISSILLALIFAGFYSYLWYEDYTFNRDEERKRVETERNYREAQLASMIDLGKLEVLAYEVSNERDKYNGYQRVSIKGVIKNNNSYPVTNLKMKIEFFDKETDGKIDEHYQAIDETVFENSEKSFNKWFAIYQADLDKAYYTRYSLVEGRKR